MGSGAKNCEVDGESGVKRVRQGAKSLCSRNAAHRSDRISKLMAVLVGRAQLGLSPAPHMND